MKIRPVKDVKAELFHADRRTEDREKDRRTEDREKGRRTEGQADMKNLMDAFRNFANAPKRETERDSI
jgi:hypothetical protein